MSVAPSPDSPGLVGKGLRKGTRSCRECRLRKVRCIFEAETTRCKECRGRGAQCTRQDRALKPGALQEDFDTRQRMRDLERTVESLAAKLTASEAIPSATPERFAPDASSLPSVLLSDIASLTTPASSTAQAVTSGPEPPSLSLFDNSIICRDVDGVPQNLPKPSTLSERNLRILRDLKCLLPNTHNLCLVLQQSPDSWRLWRMNFPDQLEPGSKALEVEELQNLVYTSINAQNTCIVAKVVLCLAIHIQQLPRQFNSSRLALPLPLTSLQTCYLNAAESLLGPDEEAAGTLDGLACLMTLCEYYINAGMPRKVWLILRRAISFAQLLGLQHVSNEASHREAVSGRTLFRKLWQIDREVSLILGLPYAVPDFFTGIDIVAEGQLSDNFEETFLLRLGAVTGRIIQRNQSRGKKIFSATLEIDEELERCHDMMSPTWWQALPGSDLSPEETFAMLTSKLKYHNVRKLLHLPFMLEAYADSRYESSRSSALEAARDMIKTYQILRSPGGDLLKMCAMVDFEVFTAAMILVIDLLAYDQGTYVPVLTATEDWELIRGITNTLRRVSTETTCKVAEQAAQLLNDFYEARQTNLPASERAYEVTIPYFGKLRILRNGNATQIAKSFTPNVHQETTINTDATSNFDDPNTAAAFVSFEDYLRNAPEGQSLTSAATWNLAVDEDWTWMPNSAGMQ